MSSVVFVVFFRRNIIITHDQTQHGLYEPFSEDYSLMISDVSISWLSHAIARIATCCVSAARCSGSVDPRMVLDGHPSCGQSAAQCTEDRQSHSGCWRVLKVPSSNLNWDWKTMVFMHGFPIENIYICIYIYIYIIFHWQLRFPVLHNGGRWTKLHADPHGRWVQPCVGYFWIWSMLQNTIRPYEN